MNSLLVGVLLSTLLGSALGTHMRCIECKGGPSSSCKEMVAPCGEGEPQPGGGPKKLSGNPSVTLIHHYPACVAAQHCHQVETELVGDVTYTAHRDCCVGDLCNSAVASTVAAPRNLAAAATALAWLLPALWRSL